jgi:AraC-like DNA-binding protein
MQDHIVLNDPEIPIVSDTVEPSVPIGQFIEAPQEELNKLSDIISIKQSKDMFLPNLSFRVFEGYFHKNVMFSNIDGIGIDSLGSCFFIDGNMKSVLEGHQHGVECKPRTHNFRFDPHNEYQQWCPADSTLHFIHFAYNKSFFNQLLPDNESWAIQLEKRIDRKERILGSKTKPITAFQEITMRNIINCPLTGKLGQLMIETSIVQLILVQLDMHFNQDQGDTKSVLSKRDMDLAYALKDFISAKFLDEHSLTALSREFGTNSNKLMMLFKHVFGKSIFDYIGDLRMDYAQYLLQDSDARVSEVARTVGYKNANHFSTAFKRRFGVIPTAYKQSA